MVIYRSTKLCAVHQSSKAFLSSSISLLFVHITWLKLPKYPCLRSPPFLVIAVLCLFIIDITKSPECRWTSLEILPEPNKANHSALCKKMLICLLKAPENKVPVHHPREYEQRGKRVAADSRWGYFHPSGQVMMWRLWWQKTEVLSIWQA